MATATLSVNPPPELRHINFGVTALPPDRLEALRDRYAAVEIDQTAPLSLRVYARTALDEIQVEIARRVRGGQAA